MELVLKMLGRVKLKMDVLFDVGWEYLLIRVRFGEVKRFKRVVIWRIMVLMLCLSYDRMVSEYIVFLFFYLFDVDLLCLLIM